MTTKLGDMAFPALHVLDLATVALKVAPDVVGHLDQITVAHLRHESGPSWELRFEYRSQGKPRFVASEWQAERLLAHVRAEIQSMVDIVREEADR